MVVKEIPLHENLNMENRSSHAATPTTTTTFSRTGRRFNLSLTTAILLASFFVCTLLAVGFIVYNFATCAELEPAPGEDIVCTSVHLRNKLKSGQEDGKPKYDRDVRLPRSIRPLKYNITLEPRLSGNFSFTGSVQIRIKVLEDCYNITMHAEELNISRHDASVRRVLPNGELDGDSLRIHKQYLVGAKQFFVIELYDKLLKGVEYVVHLRFGGIIEDYLQGFYRSSYEVQNETRWGLCWRFSLDNLNFLGLLSDGWLQPSSRPRTPGVPFPASMSPL